MTKTVNPLRLALEDALRPAGFSRKGDSWFRRTNDVVEVVNLQRPQVGRQHHLNYALWLRSLGDEPFPKEEECHVRLRGSAIMSSSSELGALLDLETDIMGPKRAAALAALLRREFLPFADRCRTTSGLRSLVGAGRFKSATVDASARAMLNA
jgi:hypothetical protein